MKKKASLLLTSLLITSFCILAQQKSSNSWNFINESSVLLQGQRQIIPQKYKVVNLSGSDLKFKLQTAPHERNTNINQSQIIISLPLPDGTFQKYRVVESPIMSDELAAAFPDIKTFSIKGIDDPYANGKLDWNEFGFHAMILSINGDFFIDPYCVGNLSQYIAYYTSDFKKDPSQIINEAGLINENDIKKKPSTNFENNNGLKSNAISPAICVGDQLRTYRLAIACTKQYATAATGLPAPTISQTLAKIVTSVNRVDGVYEKEVSVRMVLVPSTTLVIYPSAASNSFTTNDNSNANSLISKSQLVINANIGSSNYDIGHTFSTGGGGLAFLGCVCNNNSKASGITGSPSPVGDPFDIDYVAHEIGHQFGGNHTFNCGTGSCGGNRNAATSVEPGSGVTIMAYAGICGNIDNLANNSIAYFHAISYDEIVNFTNSGSGSNCPVVTSTGNQPPQVTGSGNYTIPFSTPFYLSGTALDPDGDVLTYSWEETDPGITTSSWNAGTRPYFRSYIPTSTPVRYFPKASVVTNGNYIGTIGEYLPTTPQTLQFRFTARDNKMGGGGVCYDINNVIIDNSGPLTVTNPNTVGIVWNINTQQTITWDVNGTDQPPVACDSVRILISYNSGNTYSTLVASSPNYGSQLIVVPTISASIITCRIKIESKGNIFYDISNNNFAISIDNPGQGGVGMNQLYRNNLMKAKVYPNPFNQQINVSALNLNSAMPTQIIILDFLGKVVLKNDYLNKSELKENIDLSNLSDGVYFLRILNNNMQSVMKIMKN